MEQISNKKLSKPIIITIVVIAIIIVLGASIGITLLVRHNNSGIIAKNVSLERLKVNIGDECFVPDSLPLDADPSCRLLFPTGSSDPLSFYENLPAEQLSATTLQSPQGNIDYSHILASVGPTPVRQHEYILSRNNPKSNGYTITVRDDNNSFAISARKQSSCPNLPIGDGLNYYELPTVAEYQGMKISYLYNQYIAPADNITKYALNIIIPQQNCIYIVKLTYRTVEKLTIDTTDILNQLNVYRLAQ